jgi:RNA polymerase sigma-70 factor (ECF subfamily)
VTTDELIARELVAGEDESAVRALYRAYGGGLYGFALRRLGDRGLAEEVVQDVLTRVWRSARDFDPTRGTLRTWVYGIARNALIDVERRRAVRPPMALTDQADDQVVGDEPIERAMQRWHVQEALAHLKPEHRAVLDLVYYQGMTMGAAAERMGLPVGTVKSRCFYALANLRLALDEAGAG